MTSQSTNRREEGFSHAAAVVGSSLPSLRKREATQKLLGVQIEGVKGVKYAPKPPGMYKNGEKTRGFPFLLA